MKSHIYLKTAIFFLMLMIFNNITRGQTITCTGRITDMQNAKPVAFTSVGVIKTKFGTVSDENGNFEINIPEKHKNDTLRFQCIGYNAYKICISDFQKLSQQERRNISLSPKAVHLNEVVVTSTQKKIKKFGYKGKTSTVFSVFSSNDAGLEMAQRMKLPKAEGILKEISFGIAINPFDSCHLEIILYNVDEDGFPDSPVLNKPIYLVTKKKKGEIEKIDLRSENISVTNDFFISVKCLEKQNVKSMEYPFTLMGVMGRHSYIRQSSEDNWTMERAIGMGINCLIEY